VLRVGVLLIVVASLAGTAPSFAQSLESQGYRFDKAEDVWKPIPAYLQPRAEGDAEFIRLLTGDSSPAKATISTNARIPGCLVRIISGA